MIETKYYKDFKHNFLIAKNDGTEVNTYQCKMITENQISGLLPCHARHINGELLLYYEITSRQNMAELYETGEIGKEQLYRILRQLKKTCDEMSNYLLDEKRLCLKPEYIFMNLETGDPCFLYYPFETEENGLQQLLEFLADKINGEDEQAVAISYRMLELMEKDQFMPDEVLLWFEQDGTEEEAAEPEKPEAVPIREAAEWSIDSDEAESWEEDRRTRQKRDQKIKPALPDKKVILGLGGGLLIGAGALLSIYLICELTPEAAVYFYTAAAALAVITLAAVLYLSAVWISEKAAPSLLRKSETGEEDREAIMESFPEADWMPDREGEMGQYNLGQHNLGQYNPRQNCGNTIFVPLTEICEKKLYGMGKGNKNHIDLSRLPLTVGKLAGSVDQVIDDPSISRRHVKFTMEGKRVIMTDLNSTNGTFKNGLRLEPNTSELLEPGDEIRLGKLKFIYR